MLYCMENNLKPVAKDGQIIGYEVGARFVTVEEAIRRGYVSLRGVGRGFQLNPIDAMIGEGNNWVGRNKPKTQIMAAISE